LQFITTYKKIGAFRQIILISEFGFAIV